MIAHIGVGRQMGHLVTKATMLRTTTARTPDVETCITISNTQDSTTMPDIKSATLISVEGIGPGILELKRIDYYGPDPVASMAAPTKLKPKGWQHNDGQSWKHRKRR